MRPSYAGLAATTTWSLWIIGRGRVRLELQGALINLKKKAAHRTKGRDSEMNYERALFDLGIRLARRQDCAYSSGNSSTHIAKQCDSASSRCSQPSYPPCGKAVTN